MIEESETKATLTVISYSLNLLCPLRWVKVRQGLYPAHFQLKQEPWPIKWQSSLDPKTRRLNPRTGQQGELPQRVILVSALTGSSAGQGLEEQEKRPEKPQEGPRLSCCFESLDQ